MKFEEFELTEDNHFIAMQYYGLILNRTFLVLITDEAIIGFKVNGLVSIESKGGSGISGLITKKIVDTMTIGGNLMNPYSYIKHKYLNKLHGLELSDENILKQNNSNFVIKKSDIKAAYYDLTKKWGMGYYPHDGKVYIELEKGKKREFIILGSQSGQKIANKILNN